MNNDISFTAKYISSVMVQRLADNGKYLPTKANAVELSAKNNNDLSTLEKLSEKWGDDTYASNILDEATSLNEFYNEYRPTVYALTTQKDNFEKLQPNKILGLMETSDDFGTIKSLDYLQTNPEFLDKFKPAMKRIGTAMLNFIERINKGRRIEIDAVESAKSFYLKNGYKRMNDYFNIYYKDIK